MNPCRCGHADDADWPAIVCLYVGRISRQIIRPAVDRFDIRIDVPPVPLAAMRKADKGKPARPLRRGLRWRKNANMNAKGV